MSASPTDIAMDFQALQGRIRELEHFHENLFRNAFVENAIPRYEGIILTIKNAQQLEALYRQERALARLLKAPEDNTSAGYAESKSHGETLLVAVFLVLFMISTTVLPALAAGSSGFSNNRSAAAQFTPQQPFRDALKQLKATKRLLEATDKSFGGHRDRAIKDVDNAIAELWQQVGRPEE